MPAAPQRARRSQSTRCRRCWTAKAAAGSVQPLSATTTGTAAPMHRPGGAVEPLHGLRGHRGRVPLALQHYPPPQAVFSDDIGTEVSGTADPYGVGEPVVLQ